MRLFRFPDLAGRRIDALERLPLVPALRRNEAARSGPGIAPHRLRGRLLQARVESRFRRLRLLPPVRHEAPAPGGELELVRARGQAQKVNRVGGKNVEAAREGIVPPPEVPVTLYRGFLGADETAAHADILSRSRPGRVAAGASRLRVEQRNALVVRRLGYRLQISVDVGEVLVRQDRLLIRRHAPGAEAHKRRERPRRDRIGRELWSSHRALPHEALALPAAVLHVGGLALLGGTGGEGERREQQGRDEKQILRFAQNDIPRGDIHRGCVQTLSRAGWPDCTTLTASRSAGPSCAGSLIGPFAHQPMLSASLWYSTSGVWMLVPTGPISPPRFATPLRKLERRCTCLTSWW